jgi:hypothetical protein
MKFKLNDTVQFINHAQHDDTQFTVDKVNGDYLVCKETDDFGDNFVLPANEVELVERDSTKLA